MKYCIRCGEDMTSKASYCQDCLRLIRRQFIGQSTLTRQEVLPVQEEFKAREWRDYKR